MNKNGTRRIHKKITGYEPVVLLLADIFAFGEAYRNDFAFHAFVFMRIYTAVNNAFSFGVLNDACAKQKGRIHRCGSQEFYFSQRTRYVSRHGFRAECAIFLAVGPRDGRPYGMAINERCQDAALCDIGHSG